METIFYQDSRVAQWLDLVVEKLFTVCLLSGPDADAEFRRGQRAVEKVVQTLINMSLPYEEIDNGVRQLIEQRLPDSRVTQNFPQLYIVMARMIREGVHGQITPESERSGENKTAEWKVWNSTEEACSVSAISRSIAIFNDRGPSLPGSIQKITRHSGMYQLQENNLQQKIQEPWTSQNKHAKVDQTEFQGQAEKQNKQEYIEEKKEITLLDEIEETAETAETAEKQGAEESELFTGVLEAVAPPNQAGIIAQICASHEIRERQSPVRTSRLGKPSIGQKRGKDNLERNLNTQESPKVLNKPVSSEKEAVLSQQVPQGAEMLAYVLRQLFPESDVNWNYNFAKHNFIAKVAGVLIQIGQLGEYQELDQKIRNQGWKLAVIAAEDMRFSHRIERNLRHLKRIKYPE